MKGPVTAFASTTGIFLAYGATRCGSSLPPPRAPIPAFTLTPAPHTPTMATSPHHERPHHLRHSKSSIDESLELEHALAAEEGDVPLSPGAVALDPQVLADLIIQLRAQLGELTRERDELVNELAASQTREAELTDALEQARDRSRTAEAALEAAKKTHQEDEEAVSMLRAKVEESRRALMRLQSEASSARRMSGQFQLGGPLALDLSKAPGSSKRASFTPLTGTFKRGSPPPSVPGSPPAHPSTLLRNASSDGENDAAAETQSLMVLPSESAAAPSTARGRRFPGSISTRDSIMNPLGAELDAMRRELVEARQEAIALRAELRDANESRLASEACVQALREFIANTAAADAVSPGGLGLSLPPLPTDTGVNAVGDEKPKAGWGLKLWRKDTASASTPGSSHSHASTPSMSSTMSRRKSDASESHPPVARSGFWASKASSGTASAAVSPSVAQPPAGKKFGFLWGAPPKEPEPPVPVPGLSPPGSSSDHPSEPTSPKDDRPRSGTDLVVQYDETLTDNEEADKTFTQAHPKSPLEPPLTPRNEGPIGVAA